MYVPHPYFNALILSRNLFLPTIMMIDIHFSVKTNTVKVRSMSCITQVKIQTNKNILPTYFFVSRMLSVTHVFFTWPEMRKSF
jgi:hypothetical protein